MWWGVVAILHLCLQLWGVRPVKATPRGKRSIIGRYPTCPRGCTSCSYVNGCVTCEARYFMFLYRHNMRQIGLCTPACPLGYYGVRHRSYSTCNRCQTEHCEECFSRHYCTRCQQPWVAFQGQCVDQCPQGTHFANFSRDCRDSVDCLLGPWSKWSPCARNGQTCGYKWGQQSRSRPTLQPPSPNGHQCPGPTTRSRRCRLADRWCHDDDCRHRKRHRKRFRKKKRKRGRKQRKRGRKNKKHRRKHRKRKGKRTSSDGEKGPANKGKSNDRKRRLCGGRLCRSRGRRQRHSGCRNA